MSTTNCRIDFPRLSTLSIILGLLIALEPSAATRSASGTRRATSSAECTDSGLCLLFAHWCPVPLFGDLVGMMCPEMCGRCEPECRDSTSKCKSAFTRRLYCKSPFISTGHKRIHCYKTCGFCAPPYSPPSDGNEPRPPPPPYSPPDSNEQLPPYTPVDSDPLPPYTP